MKKTILRITGIGVTIVAGLVAYAFISTMGKTDLDIKIHINEKLVQISGFGESPTFAIWLENSETGNIRAIYVTRRAAERDWEGKSEIPVALPRWFQIEKLQNQRKVAGFGLDGYSGATPKPGYFTAKASLKPGSQWICWMEVNLAADYNDYYIGMNNEVNDSDKYLSGQPALLYKSEIIATEGAVVEVELVGMTIFDSPDGEIIQPMKGITTAAEIFDEISISVLRPKPRIIP
jgi:hypothetical protein